MAKSAPRFTAERRTKWLELLAAGQSQEEACKEVGVSPVTIRRWLADGRASKNPDRKAFADAFDALPKRKPRPSPRSLVKQERDGKLDRDQLEALLEQAALDLNVQAIKLLLERPWDKDADQDQAEQAEPDIFDELDARRKHRGTS
jgi:transcriptional regulator with XRE-family HTH domain